MCVYFGEGKIEIIKFVGVVEENIFYELDCLCVGEIVSFYEIVKYCFECCLYLFNCKEVCFWKLVIVCILKDFGNWIEFQDLFDDFYLVFVVDKREYFFNICVDVIIYCS